MPCIAGGKASENAGNGIWTEYHQASFRLLRLINALCSPWGVSVDLPRTIWSGNPELSSRYPLSATLPYYRINIVSIAAGSTLASYL
jgi:hypothetical protein